MPEARQVVEEKSTPWGQYRSKGLPLIRRTEHGGASAESPLDENTRKTRKTGEINVEQETYSTSLTSQTVEK